MIFKVNQVISIPYIIIVISLVPVFFIANLLPAHATTEIQLRLDELLNQHLFGLVGFWSSLFPFSSKLTTSYISLFGPLFALVAFYKTYTTMIIDSNQYNELTLGKYIFGLIVFLVFFAIFVSINYFEAVDLAQHNRKLYIFGLNTVIYSLFASVMLLSFYFIPLGLYIAILYIPRLLIRRWKDKKDVKNDRP
ncbi:hypothetical protein [Pseudomonas sp. LB3P31]